MFSQPWLYKKIGWYGTYVQLYHNHNYKNLIIYLDHPNDGTAKGCSKTYIHFSHHNEHFIQHLTRNSFWYIQTYFRVFYHHSHYLLFSRKGSLYATYIQLSHHQQQYLLYFKRKIGWYLYTYIHVYYNQLWYNSSLLMKILLYTTWRYWWSQHSTMVTLVIGGIVDGMRPISTSPFNINSCSPIEIG